jgi:hypothetical protein
MFPRPHSANLARPQQQDYDSISIQQVLLYPRPPRASLVKRNKEYGIQRTPVSEIYCLAELNFVM